MENEIKIEIQKVRNTPGGSGKKKVWFGNPDFFLFFSLMLLIFALFNLDSGLPVAYFAFYTSGIFALIGLVVTCFRWKKLKTSGKLFFCALLLYMFIWASLFFGVLKQI